MKKENSHYSDKTGHKKRGEHAKFLDIFKNKVCKGCNSCADCPLNEVPKEEQVIYKAKP